MAECIYETETCDYLNDGECERFDSPCPFEDLGIKQTKADRIRSMTDIEMSTDLIPLIMEVCEDGVPCEALFLKWLQSEAE